MEVLEGWKNCLENFSSLFSFSPFKIDLKKFNSHLSYFFYLPHVDDDAIYRDEEKGAEQKKVDKTSGDDGFPYHTV